MQTARLVADSRECTGAFAAIATDLARAGATASALKVERAADDRQTVLASILDPQPVPVYVANKDTAHSSVQGEVPEATLDVVAAFTDTKQRAIALAIVATAFAKAGRPAEAVDMAAGIDGKPGYFAWRAIGEAQVKAGLTAQSWTVPCLWLDGKPMQAVESHNTHQYRFAEVPATMSNERWLKTFAPPRAH
jgi:hypothetical protein